MTEHVFIGVEGGDEELVYWALELGATTSRPHEISPDAQEQLLVLAAQLGHTDICSAITAIHPMCMSDPDGLSGLRALTVAAGQGNTRLVDILLARRTVVVDAADTEGRTALHHAAAEGHAEIVELLLVRGRAAPNVRDATKRSPLMDAAEIGALQICVALVDAGAILDLTDQQQASALMLAAANGHAVCMELLLRYHAQGNLRDKVCVGGGWGGGMEEERGQWVQVFVSVVVLLRGRGRW